MRPKINCKHGLDRKQELAARRLRAKLEVEDEVTLEKYHSLWENWLASPENTFETYLKKNDVIYYSAYIRVCDAQGYQVVYSKIANH